MKALLILGFMILRNISFSQAPMSYSDLLAVSPEIPFSDSLRFDSTSNDATLLDSSTLTTWFLPVLSNGAAKLKNKTYALSGKITGNENFDLFVLREEKRKNDSITTVVSFLISMKKNGEYIASIQTAVAGTKKKSSYNINACLYKDNRLIVDSKIGSGKELLEDRVYYKISNSGRFIIYSND
jgi:hypothetical protein